MEIESIFNKWGFINWKSPCRKMKIDLYLLRCTKLKSKQIKDLNIKPDTPNLIEEKLGTGDKFLNSTPVAQSLDQQLIAGNSYNFKAFLRRGHCQWDKQADHRLGNDPR